MNRAVNHDSREHCVSAARQLAVFAFEPSASVRAISIVNQHGTNARQIVADALVAAIRTGDLGKAKWWDEVGSHVDTLIHERIASMT